MQGNGKGTSRRIVANMVERVLLRNEHGLTINVKMEMMMIMVKNPKEEKLIIM